MERIEGRETIYLFTSWPVHCSDWATTTWQRFPQMHDDRSGKVDPEVGETHRNSNLSANSITVDMGLHEHARPSFASSFTVIYNSTIPLEVDSLIPLSCAQALALLHQTSMRT